MQHLTSDTDADFDWARANHSQRIFYAVQRITSLRYKVCEDRDEYTDQFRGMAKVLEVYNCPLPKDVLISGYLLGLGDVFESVTKEILSETTMPEFDDVVARARTHVDMIKWLNQTYTKLEMFEAMLQHKREGGKIGQIFEVIRKRRVTAQIGASTRECIESWKKEDPEFAKLFDEVMPDYD